MLKTILYSSFNVIDLTNTTFYKENLYKEVSGKQLNEANEYKTFYKFIDESKIHNGYEFKTGLNIDTNEFSPTGSCSEGGIYFTDVFNVTSFSNYGINLCDVKIPDNARCYLENNKIKCDKIIINFIEHISNHDGWKDINFCMKFIKYNNVYMRYVDEKILEKHITILNKMKKKHKKK